MLLMREHELGKYSHLVPKDFWSNVRWRLELRRLAARDRKLQQRLVQACAVDFLFFCNAFCYCFEPRHVRVDGIDVGHEIPFILRPHQEEAVRDFYQYIGVRDIGIEKARGEGATWIAIVLSTHTWLFEEHSTIGLVSRNEDAVDKNDDPDSLMWKIDFELPMLPKWMTPKDHEWDRKSAKHVFLNLKNGATIIGYPATSDVGSGGRKKFFVMDELSKFRRPDDDAAMASTQYVTDCRFIIGTPLGAVGAYYKAMHDPNSNMIKVILDWKDNPARNRGLYRYRAGAMIPIDPPRFGRIPVGYEDEFFASIKPKLLNRGFQIEDTVRSAWFDNECLRVGATPRNIAQELGRDYGGSTSRFFQLDVILRLQAETARPWESEGEVYDEEGGSFKRINFRKVKDGRLKIWGRLDELTLTPPRNTQFVVSADICAGMGGSYSSNSVLSIVDKNTGIKFAEFASNIIKPEALARYAIRLCEFFCDSKGHPAFLIWENNGCGANFRNEVMSTTFRNYYKRRAIDDETKKATKKPGWVTSKNSKQELLQKYATSLADGLFTNPNKLALEEMKAYVRTKENSIEFESADMDDDPANQGENHGDRVIADALANWVCGDFTRKLDRFGDIAEAKHGLLIDDVPQGSFLWRRKMDQLAKQKKVRKDW